MKGSGRSAIAVLAGMLLWSLLGQSAPSQAAEKYAVQAGGFGDEVSARELLDKLTREAFQCRSMQSEGAYYVVCGEFYSKINAERLRSYMSERGYSGAFVVGLSQAGLPLEKPAPARPSITAPPVSAAVEEPAMSYKCVQVGSFSVEQNAADTIDSLARQGIECRKQKMNGQFKVYCGKIDVAADARPLRQKIIDLGYAGAFVTVLPEKPYFAGPDKKAPPLPSQPAPAPEPKPEPKPEPAPVPPVAFAPPPYVKASKPAPPEPKPALLAPVPAEPETYEEEQPEGISGDIFGKDGGRFHPILAFSAYYTDNLYSEATDTNSDVISVATIGFWAAVPGTKRHMLGQTTGSLPGGLRGTSFVKRPDRKFQAFALYSADIERYARYKAADTEHHTLEGLVSMASKAGHGLELSDIYVVSHESQAEAPAEELVEFTSNRLGGKITFGASERLFLQAGFARFSLKYRKDEFNFKAHSDNEATFSVSYRPSAKLAFFAEYARTDIDYEKDIGLDSVQSEYILGTHWEITGKTDGGLRAGWSTREFEESSTRKEASDFVLMASVNYDVSRKTRLNLNASRERRESGVPAADFVLSEGLGAGVTHSLTPKFKWNLAIFQKRSSYKGEGQSRVDKDFNASLMAHYEIKKWLTLSSGCFREQRDSNQPGSEFTGNRVFIGLSTNL